MQDAVILEKDKNLKNIKLWSKNYCWISKEEDTQWKMVESKKFEAENNISVLIIDRILITII